MDIKEYISSGVIESYVLGLATDQEIGLLDCVRKNHPEVEQAIIDAQKTLEDLATVQSLTPGDHLREEIWSQISRMDPIDTVLPQHNETTSVRADKDVVPIVNNRRSVLSIAAAVLLSLSIGANIYLYYDSTFVQDDLTVLAKQHKHTQDLLAASQQRWDIISNPAVKSVLLHGTTDYPTLQAKVFWDTSKKSVYLIASGLPEVPQGMQYQLWAIVDGQPVDVGVIPLHDDLELYTMQDISSAQAFAITLEKKGGSPVPTLSELRVIGNI